MKNGYYPEVGAYFMPTKICQNGLDETLYYLFVNTNRKLYQVDLEKNIYHEIKIDFDIKELWKYCHGFTGIAEYLQYACMEDAFHTLSDFLEGNIRGDIFSSEHELEAYRQIVADCDGTCGDNVYRIIRKKLSET